VVSPHPDDDVIFAAGITYAAIQRGEPVRIVYMTNGDFAGIERGYLRQGEAVSARTGYLGNIEDSLIFLGYPDAYLATIFNNYTGETDEFITPNGQSTTYGNRGLGRSDFHSYAFGHPALYNLYNILMDLRQIITDFTPDHIFTPSEFDGHSDHSTTYQVVRLALLSAIDTIPGYTPTLHKTFVYGGGGWPEPMNPTTYFTEPPNLAGTGLLWNKRESIDVPLIMQSTNYLQNPKYMAIEAHESQGGTSGFLGQFIHKDELFWIDTSLGSTNHAPLVDAGSDQIVNEGVHVVLDGSGSSDPDGTPLAFQWQQTGGTSVQLSSSTAMNPTFTAPTGLAQNEHLVFQLIVNDGQLTSIPDSVIITVQTGSPPPVTENIAPLATVTASSETPASGQLAIKAVDGVADGYPGDYTREWVTQHEGVGAWLNLAWSTSYTVNRVVLYDRPNTEDQILAGIISFSDGSTLPVGPLVNRGLATEYVFSERTITSLRLSITQVKSSTSNIGLSEIEVYAITATNNPVPTTTSLSPSSATAGGAAFTLTVNGTNFISGSVVRWNGTNRTTTYVSATQVTASILAADIATAGTARVTVFNPTPGGGTSNAQTFTTNNPVPTTTSLSPSSATAGGAAFTLTVNGTNFISGSVVRWNGTDRTTTYVSSTQLTASILAADIATAGTASVTVFNPPPGGGLSNSLPFSIVSPVPNPVPTVTSLSPSSALAGGAGFIVTVTGTNFIRGSVVTWDGFNRPTIFVSNTQIQASISADDIADPGIINVSVFNPSPGGGSSNALPFRIKIATRVELFVDSFSISSGTQYVKLKARVIDTKTGQPYYGIGYRYIYTYFYLDRRYIGLSRVNKSGTYAGYSIISYKAKTGAHLAKAVFNEDEKYGGSEAEIQFTAP
jgi:LmbE family N-acetylglucosaminyl deacetylase